MSSSISAFFSSFLPVVHADAEEQKPEKESTEEPQAEDEAEEKPQEEEESEEVEDPHPIIREECKVTKCAQLAAHFDHCQERVLSGKGYKGEDCVEELCTSSLLSTVSALLTPLPFVPMISPHDALRRRLHRTKTLRQAPLTTPAATPLVLRRYRTLRPDYASVPSLRSNACLIRVETRPARLSDPSY
ncbi:putative ubiquinol-cytochrome C reductase hinge protein [Lyophyllum shimeji]|uniref:Ubiquinol-cytochrome C reductase hinge protein n=1 Tax=Lyophyllum shimeji TaxID=47721 RepID=A0A9P3PWP8_LYOSH|nr:putative ubiquinol-cytochrome C reductase hinge protein [Lyophyllum shimeji]